MTGLIDLKGEDFGKLTVLERDSNPPKPKPAYWICQCECGNVKSIPSTSLRRKKEPTRSCGCSNKIDLTGKRFDKLVVVSKAECLDKNNQRIWHCLCDCGNTKDVRTYSLQSGVTSSCGCDRDRTGTYNRHGLTSLPEYKVWVSIKHRCKNVEEYLRNNIKICSEWEGSFEQFIEDVGRRPSSQHQLDRIDPWGNYEKNNVRWLAGKANLRNKTSSRLIEFEGVTRCLSEWAELYGMSRACLRRRIEFGWSIEDALTKPITNTRAESKPDNRTPEYKIWLSIKSRCKRDPNYVNKGIKIFPEWETSFQLFQDYLLSTIGLRPHSDYQLDRIDTFGDYAPNNLRWITQKENARNTTKNRLITWNGRTQALAAWAEEMGIASGTLRARLNNNWSVEDALTKPLRKY